MPLFLSLWSGLGWGLYPFSSNGALVAPAGWAARQALPKARQPMNRAAVCQSGTVLSALPADGGGGTLVTLCGLIGGRQVVSLTGNGFAVPRLLHRIPRPDRFGLARADRRDSLAVAILAEFGTLHPPAVGARFLHFGGLAAAWAGFWDYGFSHGYSLYAKCRGPRGCGPLHDRWCRVRFLVA